MIARRVSLSCYSIVYFFYCSILYLVFVHLYLCEFREFHSVHFCISALARQVLLLCCSIVYLVFVYFCIPIFVFVNFTLCISALMARQVSLSCCSIVYPACQVLIKKLHSLCCPHSILVFVNFYLRIFAFVDLHIFLHLRIAAHKTKTNMILCKTQTRQMENQFVSSSF